jgi:hypothetical protein
MLNEKKPSIYHDRGIIGSAKELDEYGVWVKSEPQDLAGGRADSGKDALFPDSLNDMPDFPADFDSAFDSDFSMPEEDSLNIEELDEAGGGLGNLSGFSMEELSEKDLPDGLSIPAGDSGGEGEDADVFLEEELDLSLPDEIPAAAEKGVPEEKAPENPASGGNEGEFDEISLEEFLGDVADEADDLPAEDAREEAEDAVLPSADNSTQFLMKIAEELSSIRTELRALKQEFAAVRGAGGESRGFFDEADTNDKIALTGDELDNILNTADFTEEAGADAAEDASPDFPKGDAPDASGELSLEPESSADELSRDNPAASEEPGAGEFDLSAGLGELPEAGELDALETESLEDAELSLADLSDDSFNADFSIENDTGDAVETAEDTAAGGGTGAADTGELSSADSAVILEEIPGGEEEEEAEEPDISLDTSFLEEEISLENFEDEALDLSDAVIEEPDLGAEIKENPPQEPVLDDIAMFNEELSGNGTGLSPEEEESLLEPLQEPAAESLEDSDLSLLEEMADEAEIRETEILKRNIRTEEEAPKTPPARARGEELEQIIPEGFAAGEPEEEGAGFEELDSLAEDISLDEIPEAVLPEEDKPAAAEIERPEEPEVSALPGNFKTELKQILSYMDQLLESLPEEKIEEFAKSEYFDTYKKLFKELGLI